jgi:hypothetical protein
MSFSLRREWGSSKRPRARYIFWTSLWNIVFYLHHVVELYRVHVTLANLCVTHSGMMHLTLSCEVHHSWIIPFGQPENGGRCMHIWFLIRVPSVHDFDSVTLLFSFTPISRCEGEQWGYAVEIMNERYTSQNQRACNDRHSWVGLGPIYPNRVYLCHLLFMTICICLFSIENGRWQKGDVRWIQ